jgi:transposase
MLPHHLDGILNYCRTEVQFGVVEAVNGNIKALLRRGRGYLNLNYLLLKAQRLAATRIRHFEAMAQLCKTSIDVGRVHFDCERHGS